MGSFNVKLKATAAVLHLDIEIAAAGEVRAASIDAHTPRKPVIEAADAMVALHERRIGEGPHDPWSEHGEGEGYDTPVCETGLDLPLFVPQPSLDSLEAEPIVADPYLETVTREIEGFQREWEPSCAAVRPVDKLDERRGSPRREGDAGDQSADRRAIGGNVLEIPTLEISFRAKVALEEDRILEASDSVDHAGLHSWCAPRQTSLRT